MKMYPGISRFEKIGRMLIVLFILMISLGRTNQISQAQTGKWLEPQPLSDAGAYSWFPDIAADTYGNLHAVWASGSIGYDLVLYSTSKTGEVWSPPNDVFSLPQSASGGSAATRPALLVDKNSDLNISFVDLTTVYYSRVPVWDADSAQSWLSKQPLSGKQTAYFSRLALDSKNNLHLVYTENVPTINCSNCYHVFYRQSKDHGITWSDPVDLVHDVVGAVKPQILVDKKDNIHVVWESGQGGGLGQLSDPTSVTYSASFDGGNLWSIPVNFPLLEGELAKNITIGLDKSGNLIVAWWLLPADVIMYAVSENNGRRWSEPAPIEGVWGAAKIYKSNLDSYSMAADSRGNIHLVVVGRISEDQKGLNVLDLVWDGVEWAQPEVIASYTGDVPEWPRVAVSHGNQLNVVWFVRDEAHIWESEKGRYRVWYSRGEASAPYISSEPIPTITPTAAVTATKGVDAPALETNKTSVITQVPTGSISNVRPPNDLPLNEMDYIGLLAKALLPAMVFVVGIVVVAMVRKR